MRPQLRYSASSVVVRLDNTPNPTFPPPLISIPFSQIRASTYSKPKVFRVSKESVWVSPNMAIENRVT